MKSRFLVVFLAALGVAGPPACAPYSKVVQQSVRLPPLSEKSGAARRTDAILRAGLAQESKSPLLALGNFLTAAGTAADRLQSAPGNADVLTEYNFAVGRIFSTIRAAKLDPWTRPLRVPGPGGEFILTHRPDPEHSERHPALYDYIPADELKISGSYMTTRTLKPGIGAPLVAVRREPRQDARERFALARGYYGITAVARFSGRRCIIGFEDPLATETVALGARRFALGADFSAPLALMLSETRPRRLEILNLFRPGEAAESARIVKLQPFDPDKTTVLVVHGLVDSPATWVPMLNSLRGDPLIRKKFQFWFYEYPSGYPYPYSAAVLRRELDAALKVFPQRKPMILIGHSMGGMISRLMITDSGDTLWNQLFRTPPARTRLSAQSRRMVTDSLIFKSRPEVGRVVFIATPHRGSELASGWIGRLAAKLIRAPQTLLKASMEAVNYAVTGPNSRMDRSVPTSIDTLSPGSPFVQAVNKLPVRRGIPFHSIIGDRGKGDTPKSSDGIVPYWSSHMDGAVSEIVVPSDHSAHQNAGAISEIRRILKAS